MVCSVGVETEAELSSERLASVGEVRLEGESIVPELGCEKLSGRPLVVGMGPAGLFCALMLAESGYRPIIIDRGPSVE